MSLVSQQMILNQVAHDFPDPSVAAKALESLNRYGTQPAHEPSAEVVRLAIVLLSFGRLSRLEHLVEEAKSDFRSVLADAQCLEGWSKLLSK